MTRALLITVAIAAAVVISAETPQSGQAPPLFRSSADLVTVDVSVRDRTRTVTGLAAKDFVVLDNGARQEVSNVTYGKLPIDVTVALDVSYSVNGTMLERLRRAIVALMSDLGKDDRLKLIMFNQQISRVTDFTSDAPAVERALRASSAGGGTSVLDAISVALASADHPDRRQLIVVFTDGSDTYSVTEPRVLAEVAERTNATVMMVGAGLTPIPLRSGLMLRIPMSTLQQQRNRFYVELTKDTGGLMLSVSSDLTSAFRRALDEFRSSYVLYFSPRDVERKGFHTLTVSVPAPQGKAFTIRSRRGYWGSSER